VSKLPAFPSLVWVLLAGTLLTRTAFFIVWPFVAIILQRRFQLAPSEIGLILGSAALSSSITGFYLGNLSDRFGRRNLMIAGCAGSVVAFLLLATADTVALYTLGAILVGICRSGIESPGSALMSESIPDQALRELAFHGRYFLANIGASLGPLMGFVFGLATQQTTFFLTAIAYTIFAAVLAYGFRRAPEKLRSAAREEAKFSRALQTLNDDHRFLMVILATFLTYVAYAQVESTLVQYLNLNGREKAIALATAVIATNGVTIILFQFPLLKLLRRYDLGVRIQAGMLLFVAGFLGYSVLPVGSYVAWIAATWVLSMGEAILFPTLNLQADRMAPEHLKGSYFGAITLSNLGFAAGPVLGGVMLQYLGGPITFVLTALITLVGGASYWQSGRMRVAPAMD
jgi:MFS family permease